MNKIISEIKKAIEKRGISEAQAAKMAGLEQSKVNRLLSGKTKRIDYDAINALKEASVTLGSNPGTPANNTKGLQTFCKPFF